MTKYSSILSQFWRASFPLPRVKESAFYSHQDRQEGDKGDRRIYWVISGDGDLGDSYLTYVAYKYLGACKR